MQSRAYFTRTLLSGLLFVLVSITGWIPAEVVAEELRQGEAPEATKDIIEAIEALAIPLNGNLDDYDVLVNAAGEARLVLIGEASHGTEEFYKARADITRRLIAEKGFDAVIVEGDWPDAYRVNDYVRGMGSDMSAEEALSSFKRFPVWLWRNVVVRDFVEWLRGYNAGTLDTEADAGFYGLDLYSLYPSMEAVVDLLEDYGADAADAAEKRYDCLAGFEQDPFQYGIAIVSGQHSGCTEKVSEQVVAIEALLESEVQADRDLLFNALQNARLVQHAEVYYRLASDPNFSSWNWRDEYMFATVQALLEYLSTEDDPAQVVVWAHNSHVGDARATERAEYGELNIGQLAREAYGDDAFLIGFGTYTGTVTAASNWGAVTERKYVRPALEGSYGEIFHELEPDDFMLLFDNDEDQAARELLNEPRLQRAIGVIYRPQTERVSHYFYAQAVAQFDALIYFDETQALEPLEQTSEWEEGEDVPELFPSGL